MTPPRALDVRLFGYALHPLHDTTASLLALVVCIVQVWDTAGQEQFRSLSTTYYRKGDGVMVVYDASSRRSFDSVPSWVESVREHADRVPIMIVGAKSEGETQVHDVMVVMMRALLTDWLWLPALNEGPLSARASRR